MLPLRRNLFSMSAPTHDHQHDSESCSHDPAPPVPPRVLADVPLATTDLPSAALEQDPAKEPSPPLADSKAEIGRITKRLMAIMNDHVESARSMGLPLNAVELQQVLAALLDEAAGRDPQAALESGGELAAYVKQSLYDELLGEPSNVFVATRINADTMRYEPMPREFWQQCLTELQTRLGGINIDAEPAP